MVLTHDPVIPLRAVYPKEVHKYVHEKTYTKMFKPTLLLLKVAKNCKQYNCLSRKEWINKL